MEGVRQRMLCNVCKRLDTLPYDEHVMTKPHQICAHKEEHSAYRASHQIFIANLPTSVPREELIAFFAKYGAIFTFTVFNNKTHGIVEYEEARVVTELIAAKKVDFNGRYIIVRPKKVKLEKSYVNEDSPRVDPFEVVQLLRAKSDIIGEIVAIQHYLQPTSRDSYYSALCMDLKSVLARYMQCIVYPFGSTITGLDFSTSDVDVYVNVNPRERVCGKVTGDALARRLVQIVSPFLSNSQLFANVLSIPHANTPIIKCVHMRTGIACDINFKNMLGVCNTYLIKKYLSYNKRLSIALLIIKYWAKVHDLTGVGKFSNFSLATLFLYRFMQTPYNLPSIYQLQRKHASNYQDGWDAGYEFGDFAVNDALGRLGVCELLVEFFQFYATLNYSDVVLCPYVGRALDRALFQPTGVLPIEYNQYKTKLAANNLYPTTPICVQDMFELCRNVTRAVRSQESAEFIEMCADAVTKLTTAHLYPIFYSTWYNQSDTYEFPLLKTQKLKTHLNKNFDMTLANHHRRFHDFTKDFITRVLTQVYLFDVCVESPAVITCRSPPIKQQKRHNDNSDLSVVFDCKSCVDVWTSRSIIAKDQTKIAGEGVFDAEVRLSNYIARKVCKDIKTKCPLLMLMVALNEDKDNGNCVKVSLANSAGNLVAYREFEKVFAKFVKDLYVRYVVSLTDRGQIVSEMVQIK